MKHCRCLCVGGITILILASVSWLGGSYSWAGDSKDKTLEERQHERADKLRERAKRNAESRLGYENVYTPEEDRYIDFHSIGRQIEQLGGLIQKLADAIETKQMQPVIPSPPQVWSIPDSANTTKGASIGPEVTRVYGPDGPTEKSVRLLLEYRLMLAGNPRLTVGEVKEEGDNITAHVVTVDGSLVEKYSIDKKSGVWASVR